MFVQFPLEYFSLLGSYFGLCGERHSPIRRDLRYIPQHQTSLVIANLQVVPCEVQRAKVREGAEVLDPADAVVGEEEHPQRQRREALDAPQPVLLQEEGVDVRVRLEIGDVLESVAIQIPKFQKFPEEEFEVVSNT